MGELISQQDLPTAFICNSDYTALRLIKFLHQHGVGVPSAVSVIGSGNHDMASMSIPGLTSFDLSIEHASRLVVQTLLNHIRQPELPWITLYVDTKLVERESVRNIL